MKQLLKWGKELVMLLLPDNKSGVMLFSSKIQILKQDSYTIILYNRQYLKKLQLLFVRGTEKRASTLVFFPQYSLSHSNILSPEHLTKLIFLQICNRLYPVKYHYFTSCNIPGNEPTMYFDYQNTVHFITLLKNTSS